jgi:hypothetical protein
MLPPPPPQRSPLRGESTDAQPHRGFHAGIPFDIPDLSIIISFFQHYYLLENLPRVNRIANPPHLGTQIDISEDTKQSTTTSFHIVSKGRNTFQSHSRHILVQFCPWRRRRTITDSGYHRRRLRTNTAKAAKQYRSTHRLRHPRQSPRLLRALF